MYANIVITVKSPQRQAVPGRCIVCGCTEEQACEGGCYWVDNTELLCSVCFDHHVLSRVSLGKVAVAVDRPQRRKKAS